MKSKEEIIQELEQLRQAFAEMRATCFMNPSIRFRAKIEALEWVLRNEPAILPCSAPCNGTAVVAGDPPHGDRAVECTKCHLQMFDTCAESAIANWNTRMRPASKALYVLAQETPDGRFVSSHTEDRDVDELTRKCRGVDENSVIIRCINGSNEVILRWSKIHQYWRPEEQCS